jgi:S-adenosylmethionine decarboxylase
VIEKELINNQYSKKSKVQKAPVIPTLGRHIIVELSGCSEEAINDLSKVEDLMNEAAKKANATIIKSVFHKFSPMGVSGVVVISESHLSIHTWPELGYAAIDIYTCGSNTKPFKACYFLAQKFKAKKIKATYIIRGIEKKSKNKEYNFYTHKIKMMEGSVNTLKILPTLVKKIQNNGNNHKKEKKEDNNMLLLVGEK